MVRSAGSRTLASGPEGMAELQVRVLDPKEVAKRQAAGERVLSVSQALTWMGEEDGAGCQRKWAWRYIERVQVPQHPSAAKGTAVHGVIEGYLIRGEAPETSHPDAAAREIATIAANIIGYLPPRSSIDPAMVESTFYLDVEGQLWTGKKDLRIVQGPGNVSVFDHKTCSSFRFAKDAETLRSDPQAALYAFDEFARDPALEDVGAFWNYGQTKPPFKVRPVAARITRGDVNAPLLRLRRAADDIRAIDSLGAGKVRALDLPPNVSQCDAFGGCPYRHLCNLSPEERARSVMSNGKTTTPVSNSDWLTEMLGATPPPASQAPAAPPPAVQAVSPGQINPPEFQPAPPGDAPKEGTKAAEATPATAAEEKKTRTPRKPKAGPSDESGPAETPRQGRPISVLYIDCLPIGAAAISTVTIFEAARKTVLEMKGAYDYRVIPFGEGKGVFAEAVKKAVHDLAEQRGSFSLVVTTGTDEVTVALEALKEAAGAVVQGVR